MFYFLQVVRSAMTLIACFAFNGVSYAADANSSSTTTSSTPTASTISSTVVAKVVWVKGRLNAINEKKESRTLAKADSIYLHDTLVTDDKTEAQIVFTDNTLMSFRPGTEFYVNEYAYNPKTTKGSAGKYIMNLIKGGFRTLTGIIAKAQPADYKVNTPVATIGVRGTDYTVYLNKEGGVYLAYTSGRPCITSTSTLCLGKKVPYAQVPTARTNPVPLTRQPAVFSQQPTMYKTTFSDVVEGIAPSTTPLDSAPGSGTSDGSGSDANSDVTPTTKSPASTDNSDSTDDVNKSSTDNTTTDQGPPSNDNTSGDSASGNSSSESTNVDSTVANDSNSSSESTNVDNTVANDSNSSDTKSTEIKSHTPSRSSTPIPGNSGSFCIK